MTETPHSVEREAGYAEAEAMLRDLLSPDLISGTAIRVARDHMMQFRRAALAADNAGGGEDSPGEEIGRLVNRILELAPSAGLYVGIKIQPAKEALKRPQAESSEGCKYISIGEDQWTRIAHSAAGDFVCVPVKIFVDAARSWRWTLSVAPRSDHAAKIYETLEILFCPPSDVSDIASTLDDTPSQPSADGGATKKTSMKATRP